jgi:thiol:disulfide interchange protein DsbC
MSSFSRFLLATLAVALTAGVPVLGVADDAVATKLKAVFAGLAEGRSPDAVEPTPVPDLYMVRFGTQVLYTTADGRFVIENGVLIDVASRRNLTEEAVGVARVELLEAVPESQMVVFEPEQARHTVTVFTDVNCGYCRKMHSEIEDYLERGIRVRYLFFPLGGPQSKSHETMVSVWCADDRNEAMTLAKAGKSIPTKSCANPSALHLQTALDLGVRSTPTMMMPDGQVVPGYRPPADLAAFLDQATTAAAQ